jgi:hypothetical protein
VQPLRKTSSISLYNEATYRLQDYAREDVEMILLWDMILSRKEISSLAI